jgi:uncharacterized protein YkwD
LLGVIRAANADPLSVVNTLRGKACGPHAPPLQHVAALDTAAQRIADGTNLRSAVQATGYRARNASVLSLDGVRSDDDIARALAQSCSQIKQPGVRDAGAFQRGKSIWVVFAEPFVAPTLDATKTGALVLDLVNRARARPRRCGGQEFGAAPPLRWSPRLEKAALTHARDMAAHGVMTHAGSDGSTAAQRVTRVGYAWSATGENVAAGQRDGESVVKSWVASPGHCANLMSPDFTEMAVAFATSERTDAGIYWTQVFGAPLGRSAAPADPRRR